MPRSKVRWEPGFSTTRSSREIESDAEMRLAQAMGMMITQQFCQYWD
jgi:hypothetical protein